MKLYIQGQIFKTINLEIHEQNENTRKSYWWKEQLIKHYNKQNNKQQKRSNVRMLKQWDVWGSKSKKEIHFSV